MKIETSDPSISKTFTQCLHCCRQIEKTCCWNKLDFEESHCRGKKTSYATHLPWSLHPSECLSHFPHFAPTLNPDICIKASWKVETWALGQPFVCVRSTSEPQRPPLLCQETYPALEESSRLQRPLALRLEPATCRFFPQIIWTKHLQMLKVN